MKKPKKYILTIVILTFLFLLFKGFRVSNNIRIADTSLTYSANYKGLYNSVDLAVDEKGNYYIAYKDKIQFIDLNGKSYYLFVDKNLNINSLDYTNNKLFYASDNKVYCYDLRNNKQQIIINDLPNFGDYKESKIKIYMDELYITIGTATNSGVVGNDNKWLINNPFYFDLSPKDITLKGNSYGNEKTGAFVPYKTKNTKGQLVSGHFPGNGTIISYNLKTGVVDNFAWGIRNVKGLDFNSEGKLLASVGGIENRGLRPLEGDVDYIYEIKKSVWYGWPDYSGGDPVNSPRFRGNDKVKIGFLLDNHPNSNPPAPIYQHKSISSLSVLVVDSKGKVGSKDCIYFYDKRDNMLYALNKGNTIKEISKFDYNTNIASIRIVNNSIILLDSKEGYIYNLHKPVKNIITLDKTLLYYLLIVIIITITLVIWRFKFTTRKQ